MTSPCSLTLLRARGPRLAKTLHPDGTMTPYGDARTFDMAEVAVAHLGDLANGLAQLLPRPDMCIVRAAPADPSFVHGVRRLLYPDPETGEVPTLREAPRRWLALDLDELDAPADLDRRDLAACTVVVRAVLPQRFRDTALLVQASASHMVKPGLRLRVWAWLSRPMMGDELTRWLGGVQGLDTATLRPAQIIYTAAPILAGGATDPMPNGRLFRAPGEAMVEAPSAAELAPPPKPEFVPRPSASGDGAQNRLAALVRFAATAPEKQRNSRLYWAGCRAAELVAEQLCPASVAKAALVEAGKHCGLPEKEVIGTVASALRQAGAA